MPDRNSPRVLTGLGGLLATVLVLASCAPATAVKPTPTPNPSTSPSIDASPTTSPSASATADSGPTPTPTPTPTPSPSTGDPTFVPALAAIQMVGPRAGWAVGTYAIFATIDGAHWGKQFASTEEFVGVDFISATTGWAVGLHQLLGTTDAGHSWHSLGEPPQPIRSVHFVSALEGWGIAGGNNAQPIHGWLIPHDGAEVVHTQDGGKTWSHAESPANPQTVCFSDPRQGWLGTMDGTVYASTDQGQTWTNVLQRPDHPQVDYGLSTLIQCAAPHALWVLFVGGGAAASHSPYLAYATADGSNWKAVLEEQMTESQAVPGVPNGPDTYPPSFSVVDPADAAFIGDGPATYVAQCVIANNGGAVLHRTGRIDNAPETFAAAFTSVTTGWVLTRNAGGDFVIDATTDGGYHWAQQLAVTPPSAG